MDYIIIVDGTYSSGKTTFVQTLCGEDKQLKSLEEVIENHQSQIPTYRFSCNIWGGLCVDLEIDKLYLIELPATLRFDHTFALLENFCVLGAVILYNSLRPDTFLESRSILEVWRLYVPLPVIAAANYQDVPYVLLAEEIGIMTRMTTPILPCVATQKESVKAVTIRLLEEYLKTIQ